MRLREPDPILESATMAALRECLTFLENEYGARLDPICHADATLAPCVDAILSAQEAVR